MLVVAGKGHQVAAQQLLVERAGHLGHENRVVVIRVRLMLRRVVAVHRVAGLVGQRENVVEHVGLVVHQDVRVAVVRAGTERPALLAAILVAIAPPAQQARFERAAIVAAQRRQGRHDRRDRLIPGVPRLQIGQDRHVGVVVVDVAEPHLPPPHVVVTMYRRQVAMDRRDQIVVDRRRHAIGKQRGLQALEWLRARA